MSSILMDAPPQEGQRVTVRRDFCGFVDRESKMWIAQQGATVILSKVELTGGAWFTNVMFEKVSVSRQLTESEVENAAKARNGLLAHIQTHWISLRMITQIFFEPSVRYPLQQFITV